MPAYRIFDAVLQSAVPMPELPRAEATPADITFEVTTGREACPDAEWFHHWHSDAGDPIASFGRTAGGYQVRFAGLVDFHLQRASTGTTVRAVPHDRTGAATVRRLLLDQIVPLLVSRGVRISLHASAVGMAGAVVAFSGSSGAGKSTLAAACWAGGHPVVGDDALLIEADGRDVWALQSYPSLRLWPDAAAAVMVGDRQLATAPADTPKLRLQIPSRGRVARAPLRAIYLLEPADPSSRPAIVAVSRRDAFAALVAQVFRLDPHDRRELAREMDILGRVAAAVPIRQLRVPRSTDVLDQVRVAILDDVSRG